MSSLDDDQPCKINKKISCSLRPGLQLDYTEEEPFYAPFQQDSDQQYMDRLQHPRQQNGNVLACGQCFGQVCYSGRTDGPNPTSFVSKHARGCVVDFEKYREQGDEMWFEVRCQACDNPVGQFNAGRKEYGFRGVLG